MRDKLREVIKNTILTPNSLKQKIIKTLIPHHDIMKIKMMVNNILKNELDILSDKDIEELLFTLEKYSSVEDLTNKIKHLDYKYKEVVKENQMLKEYISIKNQEFVIIDDKDLNKLFNSFKEDNVVSYRQAFVIKHNGRYIIPKSFYIITKE